MHFLFDRLVVENHLPNTVPFGENVAAIVRVAVLAVGMAQLFDQSEQHPHLAIAGKHVVGRTTRKI